MRVIAYNFYREAGNMNSLYAHSRGTTASFRKSLFTLSSIKAFCPLGNSYPTENCDAFSSNANFISILTN